MNIRRTVRFLEGLQSNRARAAFIGHRIAARIGASDRLQASLRNAVAGRFRSGDNVFDLRSGTLDAWIVHPSHERETHDWIKARPKTGGVMLDVGAFCCGFALLHRHDFEHVYAFEPFPENHAACIRNVELSGATTHITVVNAAAADRSGTASLFLNSADTHSLSGSGSNAIEVRVVTLDDALAHERRPVRLIKLDIEGAEVEALRGATGLLRRDGPDIVAEANTSDHRSALTAFFDGVGYRHAATLDRRNLAFVRD